MNTEQLCELAEKLGCTIYRNKRLKDLTTFKVGGECPAVIEINSETALAQLIKFSSDNKLRTMVIGKGSNMLCDDKGFDGAVFLMGGGFSEVKLVDEKPLKPRRAVRL